MDSIIHVVWRAIRNPFKVSISESSHCLQNRYTDLNTFCRIIQTIQSTHTNTHTQGKQTQWSTPFKRAKSNLKVNGIAQILLNGIGLAIRNRKWHISVHTNTQRKFFLSLSLLRDEINGTITHTKRKVYSNFFSDFSLVIYLIKFFFC